jgi:AraC family cel operon transcriptional repressor
MDILRKLKWRELTHQGEEFVSLRWSFTGINRSGRHTHDFCELFWIEKGSGRHEINGRNHPLVPGTICYINARDTHALHGTENFTMVNIMFRPGLVEKMISRLGIPETGAFASGSGDRPSHHMLSAQSQEMLTHLFAAAGSKSQDRYAAESLLSCAILAAVSSPSVEGRAPAWLESAVCSLQQPDRLRMGFSGFVQAAGRSPAHVSRETQRCYHRTPTDLINEARLGYAARQLEVTSISITDLAWNCGFDSLAHFIRLFRKRYGSPPLRYRRRRQGTAY